MRTNQRIPLAAALLVLSACGAQEEPRPEPPPVEDTAFGDAVGTMDRARAVGDTTLQHKQDLDRTIEQGEGAADAH